MRKKYYRHARISNRKFWKIVRLYAADVTAAAAAKLAGVNKNTSHQLYNRLRKLVVKKALEESGRLTGEIEVDESYFGARRVRGRRGRGAGKKIAVVGLLKRQGKVYVKVVKSCKKKELEPIIKRKVKKKSVIYTDGWKAYDGLILNGYKHYRIHHHENEFARGRNHINGIESFWSYAKLRLAKLKGTRKDRFPFHLKECEWRFNHRHQNLFLVLKSYLSSFSFI